MYLLIFIYIHIRFGIFTILYRKKAKKKKGKKLGKTKIPISVFLSKTNCNQLVSL